jgi:parvulin-like peptidyl-prolyl isomerase
MALYVNGEKVDESRVKAEAERLRPEYERVFVEMDKQEREKQLYEWSRENVIEGVLLRQTAQREIKDISNEEVEGTYKKLLEERGGENQFYQQVGISPDKAEQIKKDIAGRMKVEKLTTKLTGQIKEAGEKDILKYYEKNIERFTIPESVRACHIVKHQKEGVKSEEMRKELDGVLDELRAGADFAELAGKHSDCPENGGDLGLFARGQMVEGFEKIVFDLDVGQVSDIFETEFGYHIAKVNEKRPAMPCPMKDVRELIVRELTQEARQKAIEKFIDAEKAKATIEDR